MKAPFDQYTFKARIQPALLAVLPLGVLLSIWMPGDSLPAGGLLGLISTGGGTALLAQIGRDRGRKEQPALWKSWGGSPTTQLLRFRDSPNQVMLTRWRAKLEELWKQALPTKEEEARDPIGADQQYEAAVSFLREATRDTSKFPLVFAENVNYGFRRNLWGLKPYGLVFAMLAAIASWGLLFSSLGLPPTESWVDDVIVNPGGATVTRLVGALLNTSAVAVWLFIITPGWVRIPADAYAQRILSTLDTLGSTNP